MTGTGKGTVALVAGVAHPSQASGALGPGNYAFRAHYNGDANFDASTSACEPFHVSTAGTTTDTELHNNANEAMIPLDSAVALGTNVHDQATVSETNPAQDPTGTVTFTFFTNGTCDGAGVGKGTVALAAGVAHPSDATGALATGQYAFQAHYNGDANFDPSTSACEPFHVNTAASTTVTELHNNANENVIPLGSSVEVGTNVHDRATVADGNPAFDPTGDVTFTFFTNNTCDGAGVGKGTVALAAGVAHPSDATGALATGQYSFRAHYNGNDNFDPSTSPCEPFQVVDANIQITPLAATNEVGSAHTFTAHVNVNDGSGFVNAPANTVVSFTKVSGPGSLSAATCNTVGTTGECSITLNSTAPGVTTLRASTSVDVGGLTLSRATADGHTGDSADAVKTFVDANIQITPPSAINPVGKNHTLTGHVNVNSGSDFVNAPDGTAISFVLTGAGAFVGPSSCSTTGGTGSCSVVIVSSAPGSSSVRAKTDVTVGGLVLHRETADAKAGDSADASKLWADASARTDILNPAGGVVTSVVSGTVVHDKVFVDRLAGTAASVPNPTGNVVFHRYTTLDCSGAATDQTVALTAGSPSTAVSADFAPTANISFKADYLGDANYPARSGACEPLTVTPVPAPAIAIVKNPKSQTVAVGGTATFSITVTNAGNTVLTNVTVTDPLTPNCNRTSAQIPGLASMVPGAAVTYSCSRPNVRANFNNVATATGTPPSGPNVTASDTAPVKAAPLPPPKKKKHVKVISHKKPKATG